MLGIRHFGSLAIDLYQGDLVAFACDGMVTSAHSDLARVGAVFNAVDEAVRGVGGAVVDDACRQVGGCAVGAAVATVAGALPAARLIHAVAPPWRGGGDGDADVERLAAAYQACFICAAGEGLRHLALPPLSASSAAFPIVRVALAAMRAARAFAEERGVETGKNPRRLTFVVATADEYRAFQQAMADVFPEADEH